MSDEFNELKFSESQISLGKKTDIRQKEKAVKPQQKEKPENIKINLQPKKKRKKRKKYNDSIELQESDSKEYIEEEEEEEDDGWDVEINNSDNDEESSGSQNSQNKKKKSEELNQGPGWTRNYINNNNESNNNNENNNNNNNEGKSSSSSMAFIVNKSNKNNDESNLADNVIMDNDLISKKKNDIQKTEVNYVKNLPDNANINNYNSQKKFITNINNQIKNYNNFYQNAVKNLNSQNAENNQHSDNIQNKKFVNNVYYNNNKPQSNQDEQSNSNYYQQRPFLAKFGKLLNIQKIDYLIETRYRDYKFNKNNERLYEVLYENLYNYFRIYLLRLIKISRIRNVSFHLYSNNPTGQIHYKFRTYNSQLSEDKKSINYIKSGNFDILFTSNYKRDMDLIDEYVELNNKKLKFEKLSSCKEKDEENDKVKGLETSIKITEGPYPTIKLLPGRRTKKKDNSFIKEVRKKIVQTQKKEDMIKQNSNTKNTLEAFLNDTDISSRNKNKGKNINSLLDDSNLNNKMDMSSRMSDNMSNIYSYTNNTYNQIKNEIDLNVYKYFDPTKNEIIQRTQKRRINVKDFIFMLENSNEFIPSKMFLLNKTSLEFVKKK